MKLCAYPLKKKSLFLLILTLLGICNLSLTSQQIRFEVENQSKRKLVLYWVGFDNELVSQVENPIRPGELHGISSYQGHEFVICWEGEVEKCPSFTVGAWDFTLVITQQEGTQSMQLELIDDYTLSRRYLSEAMDLCEDQDFNCMSGYVAEQIWQNKTKQLLDIIDRKEHVMESLRLYNCNDTSLGTTEPISTTSWKHGKKRRQYDLLLSEPAAEIGVVHDLISPEECQVLRDRGENKLRLAAVATHDGGSEISTARKALAHMIHPNLNDPEDTLTKLYLRAYKFVNDRTGYGLSVDGQEGFNLVKYEPGMEYTPHCDGNCDGRVHRKGGRVATLVMYCQDAEVGGATTFTRSNIHVLGKPGQAAFFSYMGQDNHMDKGLTYHSGCPVVEGEKWIATLWFRHGLTKTSSWEHYDPQGHPMY